MKTDLYRLVAAYRGDILVEVDAMDTFIYVKVNKGDFLKQIMDRRLDSTQMDGCERFGPGSGLYIFKAA